MSTKKVIALNGGKLNRNSGERPNNALQPTSPCGWRTRTRTMASGSPRACFGALLKGWAGMPETGTLFADWGHSPVYWRKT